MNSNETNIVLFVRHICHFSLRWYCGLCLASYFIYCQFFFDWFISLCLLDYICHTVIDYFYQLFFPQELKSDFVEFVCLKLISLWLTSALLGQPLFVMLFVYTMYWVYAYYARLFAKLPIESLSLAYYFSSFLFLIPVLINIMISILVFFDMDLRHPKLEMLISSLGLKSLLSEWGFDFFHRQQLESPIEQPKPKIIPKVRGLNVYQQEHYTCLQQRYLSLHKQMIITDSLADLKAYIGRIYAEKPAYLGHKKLPLRWEEFSSFRLRLVAREQFNAFKTYYHHPVHGAWRLLSEKNYWGNQKQEFQQRYLEFLRPENIEYIALMWFLLNQGGVEATNPVIALKQKKFIDILAKFNRLENRLSDNTADRPGCLNILNQKLWLLVMNQTQNLSFLTAELEFFLMSFIQRKWILLLMQMNSVAFHAVCDKWEALIKAEEVDILKYQLEFRQFDTELRDYQEFSKKMSILFHESWKKEESLKLIENKFALDPIYSQAYLNASLFSQSLKKVKARTQGLEALIMNFS